MAIVAQRPEPELRGTLGQLVEAGLVFQRGEPPRSNFLFKHGLLQEAAYSTLLRGPRRSLHARIAQAVEQMFPEIAASQPELIARHQTEAGLRKPATIYWQRAGELALRRSAGSEALKHFSTALRILEELHTARNVDSALGPLAGLMSTATRTALGTRSRRSRSRLAT